MIFDAQCESCESHFGVEPWSCRVSVTVEDALGIKVFSGDRYRGFLSSTRCPITGVISHNFSRRSSWPIFPVASLRGTLAVCSFAGGGLAPPEQLLSAGDRPLYD